MDQKLLIVSGVSAVLIVGIIGIFVLSQNWSTTTLSISPNTENKEETCKLVNEEEIIMFPTEDVLNEFAECYSLGVLSLTPQQIRVSSSLHTEHPETNWTEYLINENKDECVNGLAYKTKIVYGDEPVSKLDKWSDSEGTLKDFTKVEILSGKYAGERGWITSEKVVSTIE